jgi:Ca-activated chloride channel family protein
MRPAAVVALTLGLATAPASAQQPTFRAEIDLVNFGVTVTDRRGNYITDLTPAEFEIIEEGQKQTVTFFARGDQVESAPEMHVGLLFDTSGSMGQDIQLSRSAAIKFLNTLSDAEDMTLVDFDTEVRVARYGQQDFPRMVERIRSRKPDGWTALYDALGVYLDGASDDEGRTLLVLYTDGGDTRSTIGFGDLMTLIRASDVTVYTVGFLNNQSSAVRAEQRARLSQIAEATGGQAFFPTTMKDVEAAYEKVVAQIRAQYSLGYTSTNTKQDGQWRKVEIKVKRPDVRIQTRKGYFAPYKQ